LRLKPTIVGRSHKSAFGPSAQKLATRPTLRYLIFRGKMPGAERKDAVMYLVGAIEKFGGMSRQEVQKIGIEVPTLAMKGFDVNDSSQKYHLRSLPGRFSGLNMVCLMDAAFKSIDPTADIGFDLANECAVANQMKRDQRDTRRRPGTQSQS
jgi:hypothetical protein